MVEQLPIPLACRLGRGVEKALRMFAALYCSDLACLAVERSRANPRLDRIAGIVFFFLTIIWSVVDEGPGNYFLTQNAGDVNSLQLSAEQRLDGGLLLVGW